MAYRDAPCLMCEGYKRELGEAYEENEVVNQRLLQELARTRDGNCSRAREGQAMRMLFTLILGVVLTFCTVRC